MADAIVQRFKGPVGTLHKISSIELIPSNGGVFDVEANGEVIFSKHAMGRHAEHDEVLAAISKRLS